MHKLALLATVALAALIVAGCGGSSSSTSTTTVAKSPVPAAEHPVGPETAWAKEVHQVMSYFENHVSAQAMPAIQDTYAKVSLEPLYRNYAANLAVLAHQLGATKAPAACTAAHDKIAGLATRVARLTKKLGEQPNLNERQYSLFLGREGEKIRSASLELTELSAKPTC